jgi:DNA-binding CsgD family transcriptional regulator
MRARALMRQNQWPDATAAAARALDLAATPEDWVEAAAIAALLHAWGADPATAVQLVRRGLDTLAAGVVVPPHAPIVLGQAGSLAALLRGELELARAFAELRVPDPPGSTFFRAHHQLRMGVLDVYQGSPDAEHRLTRAFSLLHEADPAEVRTWTLAFLARAQVQFGNTGAARETVRRARSFLNPGQPTAEVELLVAEAWVVASEGHATEAQRMLGRLSDSQAGAQVSAALVAVDLARCGGLEEAADRLTGVGEAVGSPVLATVEQLLRAGLELDVEGVSDAAAELLGQGMRAWAADLLAVAGDLAGQGGATLRARAQAVATASGGHRTPALRDTSTRLTPTQQRVAHLAACGLTNRQIGESLDISPRTAATHLHRAYRVLGVNDRDQLARLMP